MQTNQTIVRLEWKQTLAVMTEILAATIAIGYFVSWLDSKNEEKRIEDKQDFKQALDKMDERWKWLFERTDHKLDQLKKQ